MLWHNQRDDIFVLTNQVQEIKEEDSTMAALMRSTNKETEKNCKLVRNVIESQREQKEKQF